MRDRKPCKHRPAPTSCLICLQAICSDYFVVSTESEVVTPLLAGGTELGPCKATLLRSHDCMQHQILLDTTVPSSVCCADGVPSTYRRCYRTRQSRLAARLRAPASGLPGLPVWAWARALAQTGRRLPDWRPRSRHTGAAPCSAVLVKPLSPARMQCSVRCLGAGRACRRRHA